MASELFTVCKDLVFPLIIAFILFAIPYTIMLWSQKISEKRDSYNFEACLSGLARKLNCSEHGIFCLAGDIWDIPGNRIDDDFKTYLLCNSVPYYVRDFVRRNISQVLSQSSIPRKRWGLLAD
jgi:hypothetical protein